jgi:hypothetical protein
MDEMMKHSFETKLKKRLKEAKQMKQRRGNDETEINDEMNETEQNVWTTLPKSVPDVVA